MPFPFIFNAKLLKCHYFFSNIPKLLNLDANFVLDGKGQYVATFQPNHESGCSTLIFDVKLSELTFFLAPANHNCLYLCALLTKEQKQLICNQIFDVPDIITFKAKLKNFNVLTLYTKWLEFESQFWHTCTIIKDHLPSYFSQIVSSLDLHSFQPTSTSEIRAWNFSQIVDFLDHHFQDKKTFGFSPCTMLL